MLPRALGTASVLSPTAAALNLVYIGLGTATFLFMFRVARQRGLLLQIGE